MWNNQAPSHYTEYSYIYGQNLKTTSNKYWTCYDDNKNRKNLDISSTNVANSFRSVLMIPNTQFNSENEPSHSQNLG